MSEMQRSAIQLLGEITLSHVILWPLPNFKLSLREGTLVQKMASKELKSLTREEVAKVS